MLLVEGLKGHPKLHCVESCDFSPVLFVVLVLEQMEKYLFKCIIIGKKAIHFNTSSLNTSIDPLTIVTLRAILSFAQLYIAVEIHL